MKTCCDTKTGLFSFFPRRGRKGVPIFISIIMTFVYLYDLIGTMHGTGDRANDERGRATNRSTQAVVFDGCVSFVMVFLVDELDRSSVLSWFTIGLGTTKRAQRIGAFFGCLPGPWRGQRLWA